MRQNLPRPQELAGIEILKKNIKFDGKAVSDLYFVTEVLTRIFDSFRQAVEINAYTRFQTCLGTNAFITNFATKTHRV